MTRPTIVMADDHNLLIDGLRHLLEPDFELVGTASNGRELIPMALALNPDVVLLDITMPELNGLEAARQLREAHCTAKIIFVTMHGGTDYIKEAFRAGASGYVLKQSAAAELVEAIRTVLRSRHYLPPLVGRDLLAELLAPVTGRQRGGPLSARQREVLRLVAQGHSAKIIAGKLFISQKTVEFHKASMMKQLGLRSSAELVRYAVSHGLVDEE